MAENEDEGPEIIELDRDVNCMIYGYRGGRLAGSPAPQYYLTIVLDAVINADLVGLLSANLKGQVVVHFLNIQPPLPDEEPKPDDKTDNGQLFMRAGNGEAILAHAFRSSEEDALKCTYCGTGADNVIHSPESLAEANSNGHTPSDEELQARENLAGARNRT
jgi:hypothetical protein